MFRHQKYLEIPWDVHWQQGETRRHRHFWWLMVLLILAVMFLSESG